MIGINQYGLKLQEGGVAEIIGGMIPIYGTYQDAKNFYHNPTLKNLGWTVASGLGDIFFFTGLGAGIKGLKAARAARAARRAFLDKRTSKLLDSKANFYITRNQRILEQSSPQEMKGAIQSLKQSVNNFREMEKKWNQSQKLYNQEIKAFGLKGAKEIGKDGIIQTTQSLTQ